MKKLPRIARISRSGENPAQPYPHTGGLRGCAGFIRALIREIREIRGCFFCGFINATEFLISMNGAPPQKLRAELILFFIIAAIRCISNPDLTLFRYQHRGRKNAGGFGGGARAEPEIQKTAARARRQRQFHRLPW